jgi:hypothetical protein
MQGLEGGETTPILYRLAERIALAPIPLPSEPVDASGVYPWEACYQKTLPGQDRLDEPEAEWLYLMHAFQAARYVQIRARRFRAILADRIAERFFGGDGAAMQNAVPATTEPGVEDEGIGPDAIYREIALSCVDALAEGNARPIVAANAARWGAHLLGPAGGRSITAALRSRLPGLMTGAGPGGGAAP